MLSAYRVLDLTDDRANFAGLVLAQLGAEVILVEPPGGSAARARDLWHLAYNRGKRSVVAPDVAALARLAATADVVLDCGAFPGIGPDELAALRAANPALITVSISPFGDEGPKAAWPATDLTIAAAGGQLALTGDDDRPPVRISIPQSWLHGASEAANAALIALHERARSGRGQHASVSCQQSMLQCTQMSMLSSLVGATLYQRCAGGIRIGPYRAQFVYPALDGSVSITFLFGRMIGPFTQRLMDWVHEEGHCSAEVRDLDWVDFFNLLFSGRLEPTVLATAVEAVGKLTATKTKAELVAGARERRLLLAPVATLADVVESEQLAARDYWDLVDGVRCPGPFAKLSGTPLLRLGPPPALGEATVDGLVAERAAPQPGESTADADLPDGTATARRPLEGVKVLDLTWAIAGPMATRVLADWGATVVRIESERRPDIIRNAGPFLAGTPGGIEDTAQWHHPNAGKLSLTLNLSTAEGRDVIRDLVRWADVVIESFTPKAMRNWGLGYDELAAINPSIIMVSTCLMGQSGPEKDFAGFGNLAGAVAGFYDVTGWPDRPPAGPFLAYTDYTSPRLTLAALLAALDHRRRTGQGQYIDFSQAEAALHFLSPGLLAASRDGVLLSRRGNDDDVFAPHGVFPCTGQDRWIAIACTDDATRAVLAGMVGVDVGALDDAAVAAWTVDQDAEALQERLVAAGVAAHQVQNAEECAADPQLAHRRHFLRVPHPVHGEVWVEGPHFLFSRSPGGPAWGGPTMGQHNEDVLNGILGYDADRVADLVIADAIA